MMPHVCTRLPGLVLSRRGMVQKSRRTKTRYGEGELSSLGREVHVKIGVRMCKMGEIKTAQKEVTEGFHVHIEIIKDQISKGALRDSKFLLIYGS